MDLSFCADTLGKTLKELGRQLSGEYMIMCYLALVFTSITFAVKKYLFSLLRSL